MQKDEPWTWLNTADWLVGPPSCEGFWNSDIYVDQKFDIEGWISWWRWKDRSFGMI